MNIVTGGLGFIGNELVRQLLARGEKVVVIDNKNRVAPNIEDLKDIVVYTIDITSTSEVEKVFSEVTPKRVYHLAAIHYIPECNANPQKTLEVNVNGTLAVLNAAIKFGSEHFIFASTGAVYADSVEALTENHPIAPVDIYGWSKWFAEDLCRWKQHEISITICRLFNNIGLRETNAHIVPEILFQLKQGRRALKLGNISPVRDYISTKDTAHALIELSFIKNANCNVYNVATGKGASVSNLIEKIGAILEEEITTEVDVARFRKSDKEVQLANIEKTKAILKWEPRYSLDETLLELIRFEGLVK